MVKVTQAFCYNVITMKKITIIVTIIIVLIAGGVGFLLLSGDDTADEMPENQATTEQPIEETESTEEVAQPTATAPSAEENTTAPTPGSYQDYSPSLLANTSGTRLLFFHAQWCPQCRALEADIKQTSLPSGVTVFKVDYDTSQSLRQKYGVTLQTTVVKVDSAGNGVSKFVAYDDPSWRAVSNNLL